MANKFYFRTQQYELCFQKKYWLSEMEEQGLTEMEVYEAQPLKEEGYFFCKSVMECCEKGECGKGCNDYSPKNGKSGCCKHFGRLYEATDKIIKFMIDDIRKTD